MLSEEMLAVAGEKILSLFTNVHASALAEFDIEKFVRNLIIVRGGADENGNLIDQTAAVHPSAIVRNSIILDGANIHEFTSIRDSIVFSQARVGHAGEVARSILGPGSSLPRFNYVGSSIVGAGARLGGCVSLASRRFDDAEVVFHSDTFTEPTGRSKFGAIIGEYTIVGFGSHINPGICVGRRCLISPLVDLRVSIPDDQIVLLDQNIRVRPRPGRHS